MFSSLPESLSFPISMSLATPNELLIINQGGQTGPVIIGDDVYLGQDVIVLHSMRIGSGAVVGAGSVVHRPVEAYSVAAGVPVRHLRKRYEKRASKA